MAVWQTHLINKLGVNANLARETTLLQCPEDGLVGGLGGGGMLRKGGQDMDIVLLHQAEELHVEDVTAVSPNQIKLYLSHAPNTTGVGRPHRESLLTSPYPTMQF